MLKAFCGIPEMYYVFVGNWDRSRYGKKLKQKYIHYENIRMLNSIYDQNELDQLRSNCKVYIHGHSAGGTNPSLIEAMSLGLPIFAYDVPYNIVTTRYEAKYFKNRKELLFLLKNINRWNMNEVGENMQQIADNFYT